MRNWVFHSCAVFCSFHLNRWMLWECKLAERISHNQVFATSKHSRTWSTNIYRNKPLCKMNPKWLQLWGMVNTEAGYSQCKRLLYMFEWIHLSNITFHIRLLLLSKSLTCPAPRAPQTSMDVLKYFHVWWILAFLEKKTKQRTLVTESARKFFVIL